MYEYSCPGTDQESGETSLFPEPPEIFFTAALQEQAAAAKKS
jgi:hypothetical protein